MPTIEWNQVEIAKLEKQNDVIRKKYGFTVVRPLKKTGKVRGEQRDREKAAVNVQSGINE